MFVFIAFPASTETGPVFRPPFRKYGFLPKNVRKMIVRFRYRAGTTGSATSALGHDQPFYQTPLKAVNCPHNHPFGKNGTTAPQEPVFMPKPVPFGVLEFIPQTA
ncbi:MAG TPA: hypothetical protein DEB39_06515 [Planctomycetaceae bacterium]|nr:hypothetical protein [Planctomycetaceae bacterium]